MTSDGRPMSPASPGANAHLARRIGQEFRCGCPVLVRDGDGRTMVAALDASTPSTIFDVLGRSAGHARLVVGAGRAASSIPRAADLPPDGAFALRMPVGRFDAARVLDASRPLAALEDLEELAAEQVPPWGRSLLAAAKAEGLLPVLVHGGPAPAPSVRDGFDEGLMAVDLEALGAMAGFPPRRERLEFCGVASMPLKGCEGARILSYRSTGRGLVHLAIEVGRPAQVEAPLVRIHSSCLTGDLLGSLRCDCGEQLGSAVARIAAEGDGLILYLPHEGRGIGLVNKLRAYALQDAGLDTVDSNHALGWESDARLWHAAVQMLGHRGVARLRLLSNSGDKAAALEAHGIEVLERLPLRVRPNAFNADYIATKWARCGHMSEDAWSFG